jgi:selenoprotein W-related protein
VSLAEAIMDAFGERFGALKLIPGEDGCFEVTLDDQLIYSKIQAGDFPENQQILDELKRRL